MMKFKTIPVTAFQQNCSLIWCDATKEAALVDPGGEIDKLLDAVEQEGVVLKKVFLTHGHLDHVGATAQLQTDLKLPVEGPHIEDRFWIDMLPQQSLMMGMPSVETFTPDRWLEEGDTLSLGELTLDVIFCPGHTPGHVVFVEKNTQLAFVGDVLFNGSIGRTDFPRGDHATLISSIKEKLWPLGDNITFIPGHGPNSTFGHERQTNPFVADKNCG